MKDVITSDIAPAEVSGFEDVTDYTIKADAKMFRILIAGLYSDKIRAVVRELCSNARDSHAAAGILDRPFRLQLPNRWDDAFSVRDYGVSLSHEQVMHLYTTVGASTKGDENTSVGKFGLGSKTPFAYGDSFTVTAILDGEKRIYNAFMDSGTPRIALLVREPTDEEQGVEVTFPVQRADHGAFLAAARRELIGFDVIPDNNESISAPELKVLFEGPDWKIVARDYDLGLHGPFVKQGCVLYPIDTSTLRSVRPNEALDTFSEEVLIIEMPIGSVDITPSRESLSYDPTTSNNLLDKLDRVFEEVSEQFVGGVDNAKSIFEAVREKNKVMNGIRSFRLKAAVDYKLKWRGRKIPDRVRIDRETVKVLKHHDIRLMDIVATSNKHRSSQAKRRTLSPLYNGFDVDPASPPIFVYLSSRETPKWMPYRLAAAQGLTSRRVFFLDGFTPGSKAEVYLRVAMGRPDVPLEFVDLMGVQFNKPERTERDRTPISVLQKCGFTSIQEDDLEGSIYYVRTFKNVATLDGREVFVGDLDLVFSALRASDMIEADAQVIAIPASRKDYAKQVPEGWEDFLAYAKRKVALNFDGDLAQAGTGLEEFVSNCDNRDWIKALETLAPLHSSTALDHALLAVRQPSQDRTAGIPHRNLLGAIRVLFSRDEVLEILPTAKLPELARLEAAQSAFNAAYPLLAYVGWGTFRYSPSVQEHAIEYMLLRDIATP